MQILPEIDYYYMVEIKAVALTDYFNVRLFFFHLDALFSSDHNYSYDLHNYLSASK